MATRRSGGGVCAFLLRVLVYFCFTPSYNGVMPIRCSVCDSTTSTSSLPTDCQRRPATTVQRCSEEFTHCVTVNKYSLQGYLTATVRSCSLYQLSTGCQRGVDRQTGRSVLICFSTCQTDGCNAFKSLHHLLELLRRRRRRSSSRS